jgi:hypothetical protein
MSAMLYHRIKVEGDQTPFRIWRNLNSFGLKEIEYDSKYDDMNNPIKRKLINIAVDSDQEEKDIKLVRLDTNLAQCTNEMSMVDE